MIPVRHTPENLEREAGQDWNKAAAEPQGAAARAGGAGRRTASDRGGGAGGASRILPGLSAGDIEADPGQDRVKRALSR